MIAESPAPSVRVQEPMAVGAESAVQPALSLSRIASTLQVVLATRRAARSEEYAYWYNVARGM